VKLDFERCALKLTSLALAGYRRIPRRTLQSCKMCAIAKMFDVDTTDDVRLRDDDKLNERGAIKHTIYRSKTCLIQWFIYLRLPLVCSFSLAERS
jgi:hypothetical protein